MAMLDGMSGLFAPPGCLSYTNFLRPKVRICELPHCTVYCIVGVLDSCFFPNPQPPIEQYGSTGYLLDDALDNLQSLVPHLWRHGHRRRAGRLRELRRRMEGASRMSPFTDTIHEYVPISPQKNNNMYNIEVWFVCPVHPIQIWSFSFCVLAKPLYPPDNARVREITLGIFELFSLILAL